MIGRSALKASLITAALIVAALPSSPVIAGPQPQVILQSISAQLFAEAFDGQGGDPEPPVSDGDTDFEDFISDITVDDASSHEPARNATATAFQDSKARGTINPSSERIRTEGSAEAETNDTDDDGGPNASASSSLSATIEVTGGPASYRMVGDLGATASGSNTQCSQAITSLNPGNIFRFSANAGACGPGADGATSFDQTGQLAPGTYSFLIQASAGSSANNGRDARAKVTFDIVLTFDSCSIVAQAGVVTIGTTGDDVICGTDGGDDVRAGAGDDTIYGLGGADSIEGEQGDDTIFGGAGDDIAVGGGGSDSFHGEGGADSFSGGAGLELASGGPGNDQLIMGGGGGIALGDAGDDTIEGGAGADALNGGPGNDILVGAGGTDFLKGDGGADCLIGGAGKDDYQGGGGNDTLLAREGRRDTGTGGPGPDRGRFDGVDQIGSVANRNFQGGC